MTTKNSGPGAVYAIGGAEAKLRRRTVLRSFLTSAGGKKARIVVIPTASSLGHEVVEVYQAVFTQIGAAEVDWVRPESREEAADPALVAKIENATGVFMTGGNQVKLSSIITGTAVGDAIVAAHRRGATVGGTSAGASIVADHMIAFGAAGATPKQRMSHLSVGLGLVRDVVVDQHFQQRNRYGRLLALVAQSPSLLGIGVDEDTAAVFRDGIMSVVGRGSVTVIDGHEMVSNAPTTHQAAPLMVSGARLHVFPAGEKFDLTTRRRHVDDEPLPAHQQEEVDRANADLRQLARDINSEGANPTTYRRNQRRRNH
ncbi:cyanophycinase [Mariniluteicoccus endophyticus]